MAPSNRGKTKKWVQKKEKKPGFETRGSDPKVGGLNLPKLRALKVPKTHKTGEPAKRAKQVEPSKGSLQSTRTNWGPQGRPPNTPSGKTRGPIP